MGVLGGPGGGGRCASRGSPAELAGDIARASPTACRLALPGGVAASDVDSELPEDAVGDVMAVASARPLRRMSLSTKRILCSMPCSVRKAARWACLVWHPFRARWRG